MRLEVIKTPLNGLMVIKPNEISFNETVIYDKNELNIQGFNVQFVQENQSLSHKGVLRGVHLQKKYPQGKLIRVAQGEIFDVAVDMRIDSETFKQWYGIKLSAKNQSQFYVPKGFAHGFLALEDETIVVFKVTDHFHPGDEIGFTWNDSDINIEWPIIENMDTSSYSLLDGTSLILSDKDKDLPSFQTALAQLV